MALDLVLTLPPLAETGVRQGLLCMLVEPELVNPLLLEVVVVVVVVVTTSIIDFLFRDCRYSTCHSLEISCFEANLHTFLSMIHHKVSLECDLTMSSFNNHYFDNS